MTKNYYAIYDRLAETYGPLNELVNDKVAIRSFREACKMTNGYKQHAEDLEIHRIGTFNEESGTFEMNKEILEKGEKNEFSNSME